MARDDAGGAREAEERAEEVLVEAWEAWTGTPEEALEAVRREAEEGFAAGVQRASPPAPPSTEEAGAEAGDGEAGGSGRAAAVGDARAELERLTSGVADTGATDALAAACERAVKAFGGTLLGPLADAAVAAARAPDAKACVARVAVAAAEAADRACAEALHGVPAWAAHPELAEAAAEAAGGPGAVLVSAGLDARLAEGVRISMRRDPSLGFDEAASALVLPSVAALHHYVRGTAPAAHAAAGQPPEVSRLVREEFDAVRAAHELALSSGQLRFHPSARGEAGSLPAVAVRAAAAVVFRHAGLEPCVGERTPQPTLAVAAYKAVADRLLPELRAWQSGEPTVTAARLQDRACALLAFAPPPPPPNGGAPSAETLRGAAAAAVWLLLRGPDPAVLRRAVAAASLRLSARAAALAQLGRVASVALAAGAAPAVDFLRAAAPVLRRGARDGLPLAGAGNRCEGGAAADEALVRLVSLVLAGMRGKSRASGVLALSAAALARLPPGGASSAAVTILCGPVLTALRADVRPGAAWRLAASWTLQVFSWPRRARGERRKLAAALLASAGDAARHARKGDTAYAERVGGAAAWLLRAACNSPGRGTVAEALCGAGGCEGAGALLALAVSAGPDGAPLECARLAGAALAEVLLLPSVTASGLGVAAAASWWPLPAGGDCLARGALAALGAALDPERRDPGTSVAAPAELACLVRVLAANGSSWRDAARQAVRAGLALGPGGDEAALAVLGGRGDLLRRGGRIEVLSAPASSLAAFERAALAPAARASGGLPVFGTAVRVSDHGVAVVADGASRRAVWLPRWSVRAVDVVAPDAAALLGEETGPAARRSLVLALGAGCAAARAATVARAALSLTHAFPPPPGGAAADEASALLRVAAGPLRSAAGATPRGGCAGPLGVARVWGEHIHGARHEAEAAHLCGLPALAPSAAAPQAAEAAPAGSLAPHHPVLVTNPNGEAKSEEQLARESSPGFALGEGGGGGDGGGADAAGGGDAGDGDGDAVPPDVEALASMGFEAAVAARVLEMAGGSIDVALNYLLDPDNADAIEQLRAAAAADAPSPIDGAGADDGLGVDWGGGGGEDAARPWTEERGETRFFTSMNEVVEPLAPGGGGGGGDGVSAVADHPATYLSHLLRNQARFLLARAAEEGDEVPPGELVESCARLLFGPAEVGAGGAGIEALQRDAAVVAARQALLPYLRVPGSAGDGNASSWPAPEDAGAVRALLRACSPLNAVVIRPASEALALPAAPRAHAAAPDLVRLVFPTSAIATRLWSLLAEACAAGSPGATALLAAEAEAQLVCAARGVRVAESEHPARQVLARPDAPVPPYVTQNPPRFVVMATPGGEERQTSALVSLRGAAALLVEADRGSSLKTTGSLGLSVPGGAQQQQQQLAGAAELARGDFIHASGGGPGLAVGGGAVLVTHRRADLEPVSARPGSGGVITFKNPEWGYRLRVTPLAWEWADEGALVESVPPGWGAAEALALALARGSDAVRAALLDGELFERLFLRALRYLRSPSAPRKEYAYRLVCAALSVSARPGSGGALPAFAAPAGEAAAALLRALLAEGRGTCDRYAHDFGVLYEVWHFKPLLELAAAHVRWHDGGVLARAAASESSPEDGRSFPALGPPERPDAAIPSHVEVLLAHEVRPLETNASCPVWQAVRVAHALESLASGAPADAGMWRRAAEQCQDLELAKSALIVFERNIRRGAFDESWKGARRESWKAEVRKCSARDLASAYLALAELCGVLVQAAFDARWERGARQAWRADLVASSRVADLAKCLLVLELNVHNRAMMPSWKGSNTRRAWRAGVKMLRDYSPAAGTGAGEADLQPAAHVLRLRVEWEDGGLDPSGAEFTLPNLFRDNGDPWCTAKDENVNVLVSASGREDALPAPDAGVDAAAAAPPAGPGRAPSFARQESSMSMYDVLERDDDDDDEAKEEVGREEEKQARDSGHGNDDEEDDEEDDDAGASPPLGSPSASPGPGPADGGGGVLSVLSGLALGASRNVVAHVLGGRGSRPIDASSHGHVVGPHAVGGGLRPVGSPPQSPPAAAGAAGSPPPLGFRFDGPPPPIEFTIRKVVVRPPTRRFTAPPGFCLVFVFESRPDLGAAASAAPHPSSAFDGFTPELYRDWLAAKRASGEPLHEGEPCCAVDVGEGETVALPDWPVSGRYALLKVIGSRDTMQTRREAGMAVRGPERLRRLADVFPPETKTVWTIRRRPGTGAVLFSGGGIGHAARQLDDMASIMLESAFHALPASARAGNGAEQQPQQQEEQQQQPDEEKATPDAVEIEYRGTAYLVDIARMTACRRGDDAQAYEVRRETVAENPRQVDVAYVGLVAVVGAARIQRLRRREPVERMRPAPPGGSALMAAWMRGEEPGGGGGGAPTGLSPPRASPPAKEAASRAGSLAAQMLGVEFDHSLWNPASDAELARYLDQICRERGRTMETLTLYDVIPSWEGGEPSAADDSMAAVLNYRLSRASEKIERLERMSGARAAEALLLRRYVEMKRGEERRRSVDPRQYPLLARVPPFQLLARFALHRVVNLAARHIAPVADMSAAARSVPGSLGAVFVRARGVLALETKMHAWGEAWRLSLSGERSSMAVTVDRRGAAERSADPVFHQLYRQLCDVDARVLRRADGLAWFSRFVGEHAIDDGGLFRETLSHVCGELQSDDDPRVVALCQTPDAAGEFLPRGAGADAPPAEAVRRRHRHRFLGKLLGVAACRDLSSAVPLDLAPVLWERAVGDEPDARRVLERTDARLAASLAAVRGMDRDEFDAAPPFYFAVAPGLAPPPEAELAPGGARRRVAWEERERYAAAAEAWRLREAVSLADGVAEGLWSAVPFRLLPLFRADEVRLLLCGEPTVDLALLQRRTKYRGGLSRSHPAVVWLWQALESFTQRERQSFLKFVWGRSRLPVSENDFGAEYFRVSPLAVPGGNGDQYLPTAHTCAFAVDLPPYTRYETLRAKLLYAMETCAAVEDDQAEGARAFDDEDEDD